jgi:hypothetical protein
MDERDTTAVIDRTLAGETLVTGYPLERELQELTLALAAEAPEPDADFARQLDERARLGFPRERRGARLTLARARAATALRGLTAKRPPLALLGGVASVLAVLAVVVSLSGGGNDSSERVALDAGGGASPKQPPAGELGREHALDPGIAAEPAVIQRQRSALAFPVPPPGNPPRRPGFVPGERDRRIERSATLTLAAPGDELDEVAAGIASVTDRHRGFVLDSTLATGDEGATTGGDFELRIPAARLDAALSDLAKLGQVRSRTTAGEDVTAAFVTTGDRLQATRAERRGLLQRLEDATTDVEAESLRLQLDANAGEINRLKGRIRNLRVRTNYADVSVTLQSRDGDSGGTADGLGGALDDALDSLGDALELSIRALGVLTPLAVLAAAALLATRAIRRRRREAVLE